MPVKKGLQVDQDCLFSIRGGISSVLVVDTKCRVLLVRNEKGALPLYYDLKCLWLNLAVDMPPLPHPLSLTPTSHYLVYWETNMSIKSISNMIIRTLMLQMLHWVLCITLNPSAAGLGFPFYSTERSLERNLSLRMGAGWM